MGNFPDVPGVKNSLAAQGTLVQFLMWSWDATTSEPEANNYIV